MIVRTLKNIVFIEKNWEVFCYCIKISTMESYSLKCRPCSIKYGFCCDLKLYLVVSIYIIFSSYIFRNSLIMQTTSNFYTFYLQLYL
jgi:hypothetical protein